MECQQSSSKGWRGLFVSSREEEKGGKKEGGRKEKEGEKKKKGGGPLPVSVCLETA